MLLVWMLLVLLLAELLTNPNTMRRLRWVGLVVLLLVLLMLLLLLLLVLLVLLVMLMVRRMLMVRVMVLVGLNLHELRRHTWEVFVFLLELHSPILEPDFYLALSK